MMHRNANLCILIPTRCNVTQFILSGNCSICFGWYHHPSSRAQTTVSTVSGICHTVTVDTVVCAPDDGWWYNSKHVERFPDKINCVTFHLVGYILEYYHTLFMFIKSTLKILLTFKIIIKILKFLH